MVIDFSAYWCGPCKFMEPALNAMADKFTDVKFAKLDVDELPDVAQEFGVQAMPTFVLLKKVKEVDRVVGAQKNELEKKVEKHRESSNEALAYIDKILMNSLYGINPISKTTEICDEDQYKHLIRHSGLK